MGTEKKQELLKENVIIDEYSKVKCNLTYFLYGKSTGNKRKIVDYYLIK